MFYYEAEWYWGVDRFFHLEQRLRSLRAVKQINLPEIAPRPTIPTEFKTGARQMTLEFYASLRSPYTAIAWQPTLQLAQDSGVNLSVRPVLPMVMRGVPATMDKAKYIFTDASREAKALGVDYGKFYDPIGKPVMKGYSL
jgi:2-hydroxychromene-2-carboxylate isomerase